MNFNANSGARPPSRKMKRVIDVNSMGYSPYVQGNVNPQQNLYPNLEPENIFQQGQQGFVNNIPNDPQNFANTPNSQVPHMQSFDYNQSPYPNINQIPQAVPTLGVFGTPVVQDMAMQYGQQLAGAGKTLIQNEVNRYVPVTKLKYYFAVDTKYVLSKLMLLFFPFTHKDWSVKYEGPVQPRFEINAPDLYIPVMAYVTYVLVAGLVLGTQQRFSPEQIGILASSALAWWIVELAVYSCTLYVTHVETNLGTFDLLAYSGYKFVGIIFSILISLVAGRTGYYCCLVFSNFALAFFIVRSLKVQVMAGNSQETSYYVAQTGHKRRIYFLLFVAAIQPLLSWWLSYHLIQ